MSNPSGTISYRLPSTTNAAAFPIYSRRRVCRLPMSPSVYFLVPEDKEQPQMSDLLVTISYYSASIADLAASPTYSRWRLCRLPCSYWIDFSYLRLRLQRQMSPLFLDHFLTSTFYYRFRCFSYVFAMESVQAVYVLPRSVSHSWASEMASKWPFSSWSIPYYCPLTEYSIAASVFS